jgi:hypothetical protein
MEIPERQIAIEEIKSDIIAFKKDPEKSIIENLKDHLEVLRERFTKDGKDLDISKYFENEENILKLNYSPDVYR